MLEHTQKHVVLRAPEAWGILVLCVRSWSDVMTRHESLHAFFASEIWEDILFQIGLNHSIFLEGVCIYERLV